MDIQEGSAPHIHVKKEKPLAEVRNPGDKVHRVGDIVHPKVGPHAGKPHKIIHIHDDGTMNITPTTIASKHIAYRIGAARASPDQLKEDMEQINEADRGAPFKIAADSAKKNNDMRQYHQNMIKFHSHKADVASSNYGMYSPSAKLHDKEATKHRNSLKLLKEDMQQIDELSKVKLGKYINRAAEKANLHGELAGMAGSVSGNHDAAMAHVKTAAKRIRGIKAATFKMAAENIEQIEELSAGTLNSYTMKAKPAVANNMNAGNTFAKMATHANLTGAPDIAKQHGISAAALYAKSQNRRIGVQTATNKLMKD